MWINGPGWGPMYGWWIMPIIGILFMVIVLFIISRFFTGGRGGFCGMMPMGHSKKWWKYGGVKKGNSVTEARNNNLKE